MSERRSIPGCILALSFVLIWTGTGAGQKLKIPGNPQAPQINMLPQLGVQSGSAIEITLTGARLNEPAGAWTDLPNAKITIPTDNKNGADQGKLRIKIETPKDAAPGYHAFRFATKSGVSNLRLYYVDPLPAVVSTGKNRSVATAQTVPVPCAVSGQVGGEASDYFKFTVKAGERLSFEVLGQRLGSAIDPQLTLFDAAGKELPGAHSNDAPGLQTDARLTHVFKDAGEYLVQVRDVQYRGGGDYGYLLRIGDFPCATTPIPMAAKRGSKVAINFAGPQVDGVAPVQVQVPSDPQASAVWVFPRGKNGLPGSPVELLISDLDEVVEKEPNNKPDQPTRIPAPGAVSARLLEKADRDHFIFAAKKGQAFVIEAQTHELHSPAEVYVVVKDAKGKELAKTNPAQAPRLNFTAPADGDYVIAVEHLLYWFGPNETYRLAVKPVEPDFELELGLDRYDIPQGDGAAVPILVERKGYDGPIELTTVGNPAITGKVTIAPGQTHSLLYLKAQAGATPGAHNVAIQGKGMVAGKPLVRRAESRFSIGQSLGGMIYPPLALLDQIGVAVVEKPPFTLALKMEPAESPRGKNVNITVTATRNAGFAEQINLQPLGLPPNVKLNLKAIAKGQNEAKGTLNIAANAPFGVYPLSLSGSAKEKNNTYLVSAAPAEVVIAPPFELSIDPAEIKLTQGAKVKVKVSARRMLGYKGPIELQLRNLPGGVTAPKATIAAGQNSVELELTAAANAPVGARADSNFLGNAAALKQQHASSNFTISVLKK